ncbi:DUF4974 domain-containing protein [Flavobacteriaceae bacterium F08102]|nr:DUF4974 domain-containing protein [Flavobacteriaceae bacterium F08102]
MKNIIIKYLYGDITDHELKVLKVWLENPKNHKKFKKQVRLFYLVNDRPTSHNLDKIYTELMAKINPTSMHKKKTRTYIPMWVKYAAAACVIVAATYVYTESLSQPTAEDVISDTDIPFGTDKATLTLSNGASVSLEKGKPFKNMFVESNGEQLVYKKQSTPTTGEIEYNYLTIPRGGQFYMQMDDGTKVWLNSESKIKYPVNFIPGQTRMVELIYGEAYFDVSESTKHNGDAFALKTNEQTITVLGTEFNVKAYRDETEILTTLVKGSIEVGNSIENELLQPGQQSKLSQSDNTFKVYAVQVDDEIAWRDGMFSFINKPLKDIMKVLSRWYDLDIAIADPDIENIGFTGVLNKKQSIVNILEAIQSTNNMKYQFNNKSLIIKKRE